MVEVSAHLRFGKTVIVTDNVGWTTAQIVQASLDRWQVDERFRQSKHDELVGAQPVRHWTDGKIRCHFLTCVVAMTYLRCLELRLAKADIKSTATTVMNDMRDLHSLMNLPAGARKLRRRLETSLKTQTEVLTALGWRVDACGALQSAPR
jgi:transposase